MSDRPLKPAWILTRAARSEELLKETLRAVLTDHQTADQFLQRIFRTDRRIGGRDRRLYSELIFGVFRWFGPLRRAGSDPASLLAGAAAAERIDDPVFGLFLQKIALEESAASELLKPESPLDRLNAFLRLTGGSAASWTECLPEWCLSHLDFTPDEGFFRSQQTRSPLWLRVRRADDLSAVVDSLRQNGLEAQAHDRLGACRIPGGKVNLAGSEICRTGRVEVQDLSSQCIGLVCAPEPGQRWWDACAGGGGKTLQLASLMSGSGLIYASDVRERKLPEIKRRAALAKFTDIRTIPWDGVRLPVEADSCDGVLVDAPCSGSGRWRRNPESRWVLTEAKVAELAALQRNILDSASKAVRPGGVLVYATCSILRDENRLNAEQFLAAHPDFEPEDFKHPLTGGKTPVPGQVQILPADGDCDGAFIARFRRKGDLSCACRS